MEWRTIRLSTQYHEAERAHVAEASEVGGHIRLAGTLLVHSQRVQCRGVRGGLLTASYGSSGLIVRVYIADHELRVKCVVSGAYTYQNLS